MFINDGILYFADGVPIEDDGSNIVRENVQGGEEHGNSDSPIPMHVLILKMGRNQFTKDGEQGEFDVTDEDIENIIKEFLCRQRDLAFDYEHGTLDNEAQRKGDSPASGWVKSLVKGEDGNLYADVKSWTPKAQERLKNKEYRYMSPVLLFDRKTKRPKAVHSIALTNHPSLHNYPALIAANDTTKNEGIFTMNDKIKEHKETISTIKDGIQEFRKMFVQAMSDYSETIKGNKEAEADMIKFSDSVIGTIMFNEDIGSKIQQITSSKEAPEAISELESLLLSASDEEKKKINDQISLLKKSITSAPMNDLASVLSLTDSSVDSVKAKVREIVDISEKAKAFLKLHDKASFGDMSTHVLNLSMEINKVKKEFADKQAFNDRKASVEKFIEESIKSGKLTSSQKDFAMKVMLSDDKSVGENFMKIVNDNATGYKPLDEKFSAVDASSEKLKDKPERRQYSDDELLGAKMCNIDIRDHKAMEEYLNFKLQ